MIISVTIAPLSSSIEVTGDDEPIIDYSLLEDIIEQKLVPADGECFKVLIVQVNFLDYPVPQRYTKDELNEYLNGTVVPYVDVASYGNACVSFYVGPDYTPSKPFTIGKTSNDVPTCNFEDVNYGRRSLSEEILADSSYADLTSLTNMDILGTIDNTCANGGGKGGAKDPNGNERTIFTVSGLGSLYSNNDSQFYLCNDTGRLDINGDPVDSNNNLVSTTGNPQGRCAKQGDFSILFIHELIHAIGVDGHAATNYQHCHTIMGSSCAGPSQLSSWTRIDMDWYPNEQVKILEPSWDVQEIKIRPLNLNLQSQISGVPNNDQIQVLKIPISSENDSFGKPDPTNYLLIEYRPRITIDSTGVLSTSEMDKVTNIDNTEHCRRGGWCHNTYNGFSSEGIMIYAVNERWNLDPRPGKGSVEPVRVIDADQPGVNDGNNNGMSTGLFNAAWTTGQEYDYGFSASSDIAPYKVKIKIESIGDDAIINISYEAPQINELWDSAGDAAITFGANNGTGVPWISVDIWVDSPLNNVDVDGDGKIDAIYMSHAEGDNRTPSEGFSDPPAIDQHNWIYAKVRNEGNAPIDASTMYVVFSWRKPSASGTPESEYSFIHAEGWQEKLPICPPKDGYKMINGTSIGFCEKNDPKDSHIYYDYGSGEGPHLNSPDPLPSTEPYILYPGEEFIMGVLWKPNKDDVDWMEEDDWAESNLHSIHACLDVRIFPIPDEPFAGGETPGVLDDWQDFERWYPNNWAYENVGLFEVSKGSPYEEITGEYSVWNNKWADGEFWIEPVNLPDGLTLTWTPETLNLSSNESGDFEWKLFLDDDIPIGEWHNFDVRIVGDVDYQGDLHRVVLDGGANIIAATVEVVEVDFEVNFDGGSISVGGEIVSQGYTDAGEDYSHSVVAIEYWTPDGISILKTVGVGAGTDTCTARFAPGSTIEIVYSSPRGQSSTSTHTTDANGEYMDNFTMRDAGNWTVSYTYTDRDSNSHRWQEVIEVAMNRPRVAPIAEGYDKSCGIGVFSHTFSGTDDVPLNNGNWNVRVLFAGDSIHRSTITTNESVRVEGMPVVHPAVEVGDIFILEGMLDSTTSESSPLQVIYSSPSDIKYRHLLDINNRENRYSDRIILDEEGVWVIDISYTNQQGRLVEWQETINVRPVSNQDTEDLVVDIPQRGDIVVGTSVNLSGRISLDTESTDSLNILITSPTGISYSRPITIGNDRTFDDQMVFDEDGRWTVEYILTNEDGMTTYFAESIDVSSEQIEDEEEDEEEASSIPGFSLFLALTGIFLAIRFRDEHGRQT